MQLSKNANKQALGTLLTRKRPGDGRDRTADLLLAKQALSRLSYIPSRGLNHRGNGFWIVDPVHGRKWDRTTDPRVISTVLYQLSYAPEKTRGLFCAVVLEERLRRVKK